MTPRRILAHTLALGGVLALAAALASGVLGLPWHCFFWSAGGVAGCCAGEVVTPLREMP